MQINCVAFSPDGKNIAAGDGGIFKEGSVRLYDTVTGDMKLTVDSGLYGVISISYSPAGDMIAAGCHNGKIHLLDSATFAVKRSLRGDKQINCVAFSPDGKNIAAGDGTMFEAGSVRLYDTVTGDMKSTLSGHSDW